MYIYLDKQGVVKEIINDEALRQSASNVNEIYIYYEGLQEADIGSVLATYGLPDGTITDEMQVATRTEESEIPYNAERDLKYFQYYKAYPFYHFAIADLALAQEGVVRLMIRLAQKDGEYIKVAGLICFDVEGELVKEDHGVSLAQYNYLVKAWADTKECLPLDGSKAMQGNLYMGAHKVLLNGKTLKDNNGALNYNGSDLAKKSDTSSLQSQIDTINATQNVVDIVGTKAELNAYSTNDLHANDKIEVLADESQSNANTIYEWNGNAWSLVGSKAPYYSKAESDTRYNELKAKSYDKDTTGYVTGHVPDSALVKGSLDSISESVETLSIEAVKKNTDASLKSLTLPSANDLKTKDGSNFGGLPSKWEATDVTIVNKIDSEGNIGYIGFINFEELEIPTYGYDFSSLDMGKAYILPIGLLSTASDASFVIYNNGNIISRIIVDIDFINTSTDINLSDINKKQSKLYRHTIEIIKDNEATLILTTESTISTEINTMDKFISAFTGSDLACMCALNDADAWNIHYIGIQVGTTLNDTSMMSNQDLDTGMTFTDVFGTSGYTMVDKVKPL